MGHLHNSHAYTAGAWLTLMSVVSIILGPELGTQPTDLSAKATRDETRGMDHIRSTQSGYQIVTPVPVWAAAVLALSLAFGRS